MTLAEFARDWIAPGMAILAIMTGVLGPLYSIVLAIFATRDFRQPLAYWLYAIAFLLTAAIAWSSMVVWSASTATFIAMASGAVVLAVVTTVIMTRVFLAEYNAVHAVNG